MIQRNETNWDGTLEGLLAIEITTIHPETVVKVIIEELLILKAEMRKHRDDPHSHPESEKKSNDA